MIFLSLYFCSIHFWSALYNLVHSGALGWLNKCSVGSLGFSSWSWSCRLSASLRCAPCSTRHLLLSFSLSIFLSRSYEKINKWIKKERKNLYDLLYSTLGLICPFFPSCLRWMFRFFNLEFSSFLFQPLKASFDMSLNSRYFKIFSCEALTYQWVIWKCFL